ncbi:hypothetical protein B9K06_23775 [Bacillus sp. OG2]|nr:hypothetical protein B9K06_23775 [Bacillus sp. OG2]
MLITEPDDYIAAIEYEDGSKARFAMRAEAEPRGFYMQIFSIEERPQGTVDLSKKRGDFSEFKYRSPEQEKVAKVTQTNKPGIFQIEGLTEGIAYINFPRSAKEKGVTQGMEISVNKSGPIISVLVHPVVKQDNW